MNDLRRRLKSIDAQIAWRKSSIEKSSQEVRALREKRDALMRDWIGAIEEESP